jgi:hypothetical protein
MTHTYGEAINGSSISFYCNSEKTLLTANEKTKSKRRKISQVFISNEMALQFANDLRQQISGDKIKDDAEFEKTIKIAKNSLICKLISDKEELLNALKLAASYVPDNISEERILIDLVIEKHETK